MSDKAEYIGKAHEKATRDLLNGEAIESLCSDSMAQLEHLDSDNRERVLIGAEKAAEFIRENTPFEIASATEEGDDRKADPDDDTDLVVVSAEGEQKEWSLKLTSNTAINVRNTLASKMCQDIFEQPINEVLTAEELDLYKEWTQKYAADECSGSEMAGVLTPIFADKFTYAIEKAESALRENLLKEVRLESNTVAVKVTAAGYFHGFASMERDALNKLDNGAGTLEAYTTEKNNTSIFFDVDGESAFRIDMYGQYAGGRMERVKTVYRVTFN